MADSITGGNPYSYSGNPNPSDVAYVPPTYVQPPPPVSSSTPPPPTTTTAGSPPITSSGGPLPPTLTGTGTWPPTTAQSSAAMPAANAAMAAQPNTDWGAIFNPPWVGQQSQQWLDFMTGPQGVQFQNQLAQQQEDLQKQIQTAAYTGDWNGVQTLQAQLQNVQIALAQNQAQVNDTLAQSNLTGAYHGAPTLQAQELINQMGLASADQALQARGQDVSMAQIQAQLAQSPLVAWYTARGLPPPTTAIMQGPAAWTPTTQTWDWSERGGIAPTGWSSVQDQVPLPPGISPAA